MKTSLFSFITTFCLILMISSCTMCSKKTEEKTAAEELSDAMDDLTKTGNETEGDYTDAMQKMQNAMDKLKQEGKVVEPVNFRVLKEGIPETFLGMERTKNEGETTGAMGFKVSTAKATFEDGDRRADIEIIDVGGIGMAAMGMAAWAMAEVDKEYDGGYERTTTFQGQKAFEKCKGERCEFSTWMGQRIIFNVKCYNIKMNEIKKGVKKDCDINGLMDSVADES